MTNRIMSLSAKLAVFSLVVFSFTGVAWAACCTCGTHSCPDAWTCCGCDPDGGTCNNCDDDEVCKVTSGCCDNSSATACQVACIDKK